MPFAQTNDTSRPCTDTFIPNAPPNGANNLDACPGKPSTGRPNIIGDAIVIDPGIFGMNCAAHGTTIH